jgi:hypothetical protein
LSQLSNCTATTKIASQENSKGHVNGALRLFFCSTTLDNFPLAAAGCLSPAMAIYVNNIKPGPV